LPRIREPDALRDGTEINARANQIDQFARTKLSGGEGSSSRCVLADAPGKIEVYQKDDASGAAR
jgi:hypothetical protein